MKLLTMAVAGVLFCHDVLAAAATTTSTLSVTRSVVLLQPNTNAYEGVLLESCVGGTATIRVVLAAPNLIQGQNALWVLAEGDSTPAIRADASGDLPEITAFDGTSAIGCLLPGAHIALVLNEGGLLGSLDVVIGSGVVR